MLSLLPPHRVVGPFSGSCEQVSARLSLSRIRLGLIMALPTVTDVPSLSKVYRLSSPILSDSLLEQECARVGVDQLEAYLDSTVGGAGTPHPVCRAKVIPFLGGGGREAQRWTVCFVALPYQAEPNAAHRHFYINADHLANSTTWERDLPPDLTRSTYEDQHQQLETLTRVAAEEFPEYFENTAQGPSVLPGRRMVCLSNTRHGIHSVVVLGQERWGMLAWGEWINMLAIAMDRPDVTTPYLHQSLHGLASMVLSLIASIQHCRFSEIPSELGRKRAALARLAAMYPRLLAPGETPLQDVFRAAILPAALSHHFLPGITAGRLPTDVVGTAIGSTPSLGLETPRLTAVCLYQLIPPQLAPQLAPGVYASLLPYRVPQYKQLLEAVGQHAQLLRDRAHTILLIADTRPVQDIPGAKVVFPLLLARVRHCIKEEWEILVVHIGPGSPLHGTLCYHGTPLVMHAAYVATQGRCNIVAIDSDSMLPTLWDVSHVAQIAQTIHFTEDGPTQAAMIFPDERRTAANAGIVILPAMTTVQYAQMRVDCARGTFPAEIFTRYEAVAALLPGVGMEAERELPWDIQDQWYGAGPVYKLRGHEYYLSHWPQHRRGRQRGWYVTGPQFTHPPYVYTTTEHPLNAGVPWLDSAHQFRKAFCFLSGSVPWPDAIPEQILWTWPYQVQSLFNTIGDTLPIEYDPRVHSPAAPYTFARFHDRSLALRGSLFEDIRISSPAHAVAAMAIFSMMALGEIRVEGVTSRSPHLPLHRYAWPLWRQYARLSYEQGFLYLAPAISNPWVGCLALPRIFLSHDDELRVQGGTSISPTPMHFHDMGISKGRMDDLRALRWLPAIDEAIFGCQQAELPPIGAMTGRRGLGSCITLVGPAPAAMTTPASEAWKVFFEQMRPSADKWLLTQYQTFRRWLGWSGEVTTRPRVACTILEPKSDDVSGDFDGYTARGPPSEWLQAADEIRFGLAQHWPSEVSDVAAGAGNVQPVIPARVVSELDQVARTVHQLSVGANTIQLVRSCASHAFTFYGWQARPHAGALVQNEYALYSADGATAMYGAQGLQPGPDGMAEVGFTGPEKEFAAFNHHEPEATRRWRSLLVEVASQMRKEPLEFPRPRTAQTAGVPRLNPHQYTWDPRAAFALRLTFAALLPQGARVRLTGISAGTVGVLAALAALQADQILSSGWVVERVDLYALAASPAVLLQMVRAFPHTPFYLYITVGDRVCPVDPQQLLEDLAALHGTAGAPRNLHVVLISGPPAELRAAMGHSLHGIYEYIRAIIPADKWMDGYRLVLGGVFPGNRATTLAELAAVVPCTQPARQIVFAVIALFRDIHRHAQGFDTARQGFEAAVVALVDDLVPADALCLAVGGRAAYDLVTALLLNAFGRDYTIGSFDGRSSRAAPLGGVRHFRAPTSQIHSLLATVTAHFHGLSALAVITILASIANDIGTVVNHGAGRSSGPRGGSVGQAFLNTYRLRRTIPLSKEGARRREAPSFTPPVKVQLQLIGKAATYAGLYMVKFMHQGGRPTDWLMFTDMSVEEEEGRAADFTWPGVHPDLVGLAPDRIVTLELRQEDRYSWDSMERPDPTHHITGMVIDAEYPKKKHKEGSATPLQRKLSRSSPKSLRLAVPCAWKEDGTVAAPPDGEFLVVDIRRHETATSTKMIEALAAAPPVSALQFLGPTVLEPGPEAEALGLRDIHPPARSAVHTLRAGLQLLWDLLLAMPEYVRFRQKAALLHDLSQRDDRDAKALADWGPHVPWTTLAEEGWEADAWWAERLPEGPLRRVALDTSFRFIKRLMDPLLAEAPHLPDIFIWLIGLVRDAQVGLAISLLQGPPGTGKTYLLVTLLLLLACIERAEGILVHSIQNTTVDNIQQELDLLLNPGGTARARFSRVLSNRLEQTRGTPGPFPNPPNFSDRPTIILATTAKSGVSCNQFDIPWSCIGLTFADEAQQQMELAALQLEARELSHVLRVRVGDQMQDSGGKATRMQQGLERKHAGRGMRNRHLVVTNSRMQCVSILHQVVAMNAWDAVNIYLGTVGVWMESVYEALRAIGHEKAAAGWKAAVAALREVRAAAPSAAPPRASPLHPVPVIDLPAKLPVHEGFSLFGPTVAAMMALLHLRAFHVAGLTEVAAYGFAPIPVYFLTLAECHRSALPTFQFVARCLYEKATLSDLGPPLPPSSRVTARYEEAVYRAWAEPSTNREAGVLTIGMPDLTAGTGRDSQERRSALQQQVSDMAWMAMALSPAFLALAGAHISTGHPLLFQSTHNAFLDHVAIHTLIGAPHNIGAGREAPDTPWAIAAKASPTGTVREAVLQRTFDDGRFFSDDARACVFKTTGKGSIGQTAGCTATFIPKLNAFTTDTASVNVLLTRAELMQFMVIPGRLGPNDLLSNFARYQLALGTYRLPTLSLPMEFMCRSNFFELEAAIDDDEWLQDLVGQDAPLAVVRFELLRYPLALLRQFRHDTPPRVLRSAGDVPQQVRQDWLRKQLRYSLGLTIGGEPVGPIFPGTFRVMTGDGNVTRYDYFVPAWSLQGRQCIIAGRSLPDPHEADSSVGAIMSMEWVWAQGVSVREGLHMESVRNPLLPGMFRAEEGTTGTMVLRTDRFPHWNQYIPLPLQAGIAIPLTFHKGTRRGGGSTHFTATFLYPTADRYNTVPADQRFSRWYLSVDRAGGEALEEEEAEDEDPTPAGVDPEACYRFRERLREQCSPSSDPRDRQQFFLSMIRLEHDKEAWAIRLSLTSLSRYALAAGRLARAWSPVAGRAYGGVAPPQCPAGADLDAAFAELTASLVAWVMQALASSHEWFLRHRSRKDVMCKASYRGLEHQEALNPWTWHGLCRSAFAGATGGPLQVEWEDRAGGTRLPRAVTITLAPSWAALMAAGFTTRIGQQQPTHFISLQPPVGVWGHSLRGDVIVPHRLIDEALGLAPLMDAQQRLLSAVDEDVLRTLVGSYIPADANELYVPYEERILAYSLDTYAGGRDGVSCIPLDILLPGSPYSPCPQASETWPPRSFFGPPPVPLECLSPSLASTPPDPGVDAVLASIYPAEGQSPVGGVVYHALDAPPSIVYIPRLFSGGATFTVPPFLSSMWNPSHIPSLCPCSHFSDLPAEDEAE